MKNKLFFLFLLCYTTHFSQTLQQAGISTAAQNFIANSDFEQQILDDTRLKAILNGLIFSEAVPSGSNIVRITTVNQLINLNANTTYLVDGNFSLNPNQTINVPSNVTIYIRGRIFKRGDHNTIVPGSDIGRENDVEHIFDIRSKRNIRIIGVDNALIESNAANDLFNRATAFYITGNSNNIEIRGLHIKNVWEGVNCRFGVDRVLIRNNYFQNINKRAVWLLGANECTVVHNFMENAGWDGVDLDAFAGSRSKDFNVDRRPSGIGATVGQPLDNLGNTVFENIVVGAGRFMGFVEEGGRDSFWVNNIGIMANYLPANPIRLGFQLGWADNGSTTTFFNESGLKTEDNIFITNALYRPEAYNVEVRAGRVSGSGDYIANSPGRNPITKGITYFYQNEAFGRAQNGRVIGKASGNFFTNTVCDDEIPNNFSSFDNRYEDFNPRARINALIDVFRQNPTTPLPSQPGDCSVAPSGLTVSSSTETSITVSYNNTPNDGRTFELRAYAAGTFTGNINTGALAFASGSQGSSTITINGLELGTNYDLVLRALCAPGTSPVAVVSGTTAGGQTADCSAAPSGLTVSDTSETSITVSYNNTPNDGRTFELRAYAMGTFAGDINSGAVAFASGAQGSSTITINGLELGTDYDLVLRALCAPGSSPVAVVSGTTAGTQPADCSVAPSGLAISSATDTSITVSYNNTPSDGRIFELRAFEAGTFAGDINSGAVAFASGAQGSSSITIEGLEPGTNYELVLRAICTTEASPIIRINGTTTGFTPGDCSIAPSGLTVSNATETSITVSYANTPNDGRRFELRAFVSGTFTGDINAGASAFAAGARGSSSITIEGLESGISYDLVLRALCVPGTVPSTVATVIGNTISDNCNSAPTGLTLVNVTDSSITFSFDNTVNNSRRFELRAYPPGGLNPEDININALGYAFAEAGSSTITMTNLQAGTAYDFSLRALCLNQQPGISLTTNPISATTGTALKSLKKIDLSVYPNPTLGPVNVNTDATFDQIVIFNSFGMEVASFDHKSLLDLSSLSTGVYYANFVNASTSDIVIKQIVKK